MSGSRSDAQPAGRFAEIEHLLASRGHDLRVGRLRVAAGRSGVAVGFPRDPIVHLAWPAIGALGVLYVAWLRRARRR